MQTAAPRIKRAAVWAGAALLAAAVLAGAVFLWQYAASAPARQRLAYTGMALQFHTRAWLRDLTAAELGRDGAADDASQEAQAIAALVDRLARMRNEAGWGRALMLPGPAIEAVQARWRRAGALAQDYLAAAAAGGTPAGPPPVPVALMQAATALQADSDALAAATAAAGAGYTHDFVVVYAVGVAALLMLALNAFYGYRAFQGRLAYSAVQNARYRAAMQQLRAALAELAQGRMPPPVDAPAGMDAVAEQFNEVVHHWGGTMTGLRSTAAELERLIEQARGKAAGLKRAAAAQVSPTTSASATLNRVIPAMEALAQTLGPLVAAQRRVGEGAQSPAAAGLVPVVAGVGGDLDRLAAALDQLNVLVLHLVIRIHGGGEGPRPEAPPYANQALRLAHECNEAVKGLRAAVAASPPAAAPGPEPQAPADGGAAGAPEALREHAAALVSVLDDMDALHGYTMDLANAAAELSQTIRRMSEAVHGLGRDAENYKSNLP